MTAVDSLDGALIAAIGQKVFIHAFQDDNLRATGFVDTQVSACARRRVKVIITAKVNLIFIIRKTFLAL